MKPASAVVVALRNRAAGIVDDGLAEVISVNQRPARNFELPGVHGTQLQIAGGLGVAAELLPKRGDEARGLVVVAPGSRFGCLIELGARTPGGSRVRSPAAWSPI